MPKTRLKMNEETYQRLIKEDISKNESYSAFMRQLDIIMKEQNMLLTDREEGIKKVDRRITKVKDLEEKMVKLLAAGRKLMEVNDEYVNARKHMLADAMKAVEKDRSVLTEALGRSESVEKVSLDKKTITVNLEGKTTGKVGAMNSQRIPLKTASGTKGFFTAANKLSNSKKRENIIEKYGKDLPDEVKKQFYSVIKIKEWSKKGNILCSGIEGNKKCFTEGDKNRNLNINLAIDKLEFPVEVKGMVNRDENVKKAVGNILNALGNQSFSEQFLAQTGIEEGLDVAKRNITMCEVADMLGCGHVVARASHMKLVDGGKTVEGIFMENVSGKDINRITSDDPFHNVEGLAFNSPEFLHQLSDLQVLDYICGNKDRHLGNMLYDLQKNEKGEYYIKGVKGIDNDAAFGDISGHSGFMTDPQNIDHISKKMYDIVVNGNLDERIQNMLLTNGYTSREAAAAAERVAVLRASLICNKNLQILEDDQWKKFKCSDLARKQKSIYSSNIYTKMQALQKSLNQGSYKGNKETETAEIDFRDVRSATEKELEINQLAKFHKHGEKMRRINELRWPSKEFKEMRNKLWEIEKFALDKNSSDEPMTKDDKEKLTEMTTDLVKSCNHYLSLKKLVPKTETGVQRQQYAVDLCRFAEKMLEKGFEFNVDKQEKDMEGPEM